MWDEEHNVAVRTWIGLNTTGHMAGCVNIDCVDVQNGSATVNGSAAVHVQASLHVLHVSLHLHQSSRRDVSLMNTGATRQRRILPGAAAAL